MARKPTSDATRISRTAARSTLLATAIADANAYAASPLADAQTARAMWAEVATLAGNIQRDSRQLAGLGRGG